MNETSMACVESLRYKLRGDIISLASARTIASWYMSPGWAGTDMAALATGANVNWQAIIDATDRELRESIVESTTGDLGTESEQIMTLKALRAHAKDMITI